MRAIIISLLVFLSLPLLYSGAAAADNAVFGVCNSDAANTDVCKDVKSQPGTGNSDPVITTLKLVINVISYAMGVAAVIIIIISGLRMVLGGSDPQTIASARNQILYAVVGILIAVLAQTIVVFVLDKVS